MATNIDPAMVPLLPEEMGDEPMVEIEIEDPESVKIGMGGLEIELEPAAETAEDFDANLADEGLGSLHIKSVYDFDGDDGDVCDA